MGFFDSVLSYISTDVHADAPGPDADNQAADHLDPKSDKAYGDAHETPDSEPNVDKGTEQTSPDLTGTPKETSEDDKPFQGKTDDDEEKEEGGDEEEGGDDAEEEEEEEEEPVDPMPALAEECARSKECHHHKQEYDTCVERVTAAQDSEQHKGPHEDCVEEFFHLSHCAMQCAAPKLWKMLA